VARPRDGAGTTSTLRLHPGIGRFCLCRLGSGRRRGHGTFGVGLWQYAAIAAELHGRRCGGSRPNCCSERWKGSVLPAAVRVGTSEKCACPPPLVSGSGPSSARLDIARTIARGSKTSSCCMNSRILRRADDWTNLIQKIVRAIFFFHPRCGGSRAISQWNAKWLATTLCWHKLPTRAGTQLAWSHCWKRAWRIGLTEKGPADQRWSMAQAAVHRASEAALRLARILDSNRPSATRVWKPALGNGCRFSSVLCLAAFPHAPQFVAF